VNCEQWARLDFLAKRLNAEQGAALEAIATVLPKLGPNAVQMLVEAARGHEVGVPYGDWPETEWPQVDGRDMLTEACAESRDGQNYLIAEELKTLKYLSEIRKARAAFRAAHNALCLADTIRPEALRPPAEPMLAGG
jgi:hypothetical protein